MEISEHNRLVDCQEPHAELLDLATRTIWQSHRSMDHEAYEALEPPAGWVKLGIGCGVMESHYFRRSPGASMDGPVATREIAGQLFICCANPPAGGPSFQGPVSDFGG